MTASLRGCFAAACWLLASVALPAGVLATEEFLPLDEYLGPDGLGGDAIYQKMLDNRFQSYEQVLSMRSGDQSGKFQQVRMGLKYKRFDPKQKGILSKTIAKYYDPPDVRHLGYLIINKDNGQDDQFVYRPSTRKVRRINVRGEAIAGTDFSFEDVVPPEFEDGDHYRMSDEILHGVDTFVVTMVPKPSTESEYAKLLLHIDKERFVPIRIRYWDNKRVLIKQMDADLDSMQKFEGVDAPEGETRTVWIAERSRMDNLKSGGFTLLEISELTPDPDLRNHDFSQRKLTASR